MRVGLGLKAVRDQLTYHIEEVKFCVQCQRFTMPVWVSDPLRLNV